MQVEYIIALIGFITSQSIAIIGSIYNAGTDTGMKEAVIMDVCVVIAAIISAKTIKNISPKDWQEENRALKKDNEKLIHEKEELERKLREYQEQQIEES
jgi:hypothetical protein